MIKWIREELKMSNQNSKNTGMNQTNTAPVKSLWESKPATGSSLGITEADLRLVPKESVKIQSSEVQARIKAFEVSVNHESMNRVFNQVNSISYKET